MAVRRRKKIKTTGKMVLVNPRRRRRARRRNPSRARARRAAPKVGYRRRRRSNPAPVRAIRRRRRIVRRRARRAISRVAPRRRMRMMRRRAFVARRRNPSSGGGMLSKIPLVGPILAGAFGFLPAAAFGALGVLPTVKALQLAATYIGPVNMIPAPIAYAGTGVILGAIVNKYAPVSPGTRSQLATAIAAAAGGVAAYKWMQGEGEATISEELAGFGPEWVTPGYGGTLVYGDSLGALYNAYADPTSGSVALDAAYSADDFSPEEAAVLGAVRPPAGVMQRFPFAPAPRAHGVSRHAAMPLHQWGWLVNLIGVDQVRELAQRSPAERQAYIAALKQQAMALVQQTAA